MRALLLIGLLMPVPAIADDGCLFGCDGIVAGNEARGAAEALLGIAVPAEAEVVGLVNGGFQDRFVQLRIDLPDLSTAKVVLRSLGTALADLTPSDDAGFGPPGPAWWDVEDRRSLTVSSATLPGFASALVGLAPASEGRLSLYLWAFQT